MALRVSSKTPQVSLVGNDRAGTHRDCLPLLKGVRCGWNPQVMMCPLPPSSLLDLIMGVQPQEGGRRAHDIVHGTFIVPWPLIWQINSILIGILETNEKKLQVLDGLFSGFLNLSDLILTN